MTMRLLTLAVCGLVAFSGAAAQDPKKDKDEKVRIIDLKGVKIDSTKGDPAKPTVIAKTEELDKTIEDKDGREKVAKQVNFGKDQLLLFAWQGSGGDKLTHKVEDEKGKVVVVFVRMPGATADVRNHAHMYALPKDATWRIGK